MEVPTIRGVRVKDGLFPAQMEIEGVHEHDEFVNATIVSQDRRLSIPRLGN